nr:SGNH/GDSL hydrolase family protein [Cupriavidus sp. SHE]
MQKHRLAAVVISATPWLFGCGGGGGEPQAGTPSPVTPAKTVRIEAYGDSTMWGQDGAQPPVVQASITQPSSAQAALQSGYGTTVTVVNEGVPGTTAANIINGTDGKHLPWAQQMANSQAQIVAVNFCINDSNPAFKESTDTYRALLVQIVNIARAAGKVILLVEPNRVEPYWLPDTPHYVSVMRDVAAEMSVPLVPNFAYPAVIPDGVHPDAATYAAMGERMAAVLSPVVASLLKQ